MEKKKHIKDPVPYHAVAGKGTRHANTKQVHLAPESDTEYESVLVPVPDESEPEVRIGET